MKPKRIQRKRTKGWKMPPNTVYVGRPSKWGNPILRGSVIGKKMVVTKEEVVKVYEDRLFMILGLQGLNIKELKGKDLACWCPLDQPCHADILLEVANGNP